MKTGKAKKNIIYGGTVYKAGEKITVEDRDAHLLETVGAVTKVKDEVIEVPQGLPPLDAPRKRK